MADGSDYEDADGLYGEADDAEDGGDYSADDEAYAGAADDDVLDGELSPEQAADAEAFAGDEKVIRTVEMDRPPVEETRVTKDTAERRRQARLRRRKKQRAHVLVRRAGEPPAEVPIDRAVLTFGRDPSECDIVLNGPAVSRMHARIERDERGYYTLLDCKSRNGTYVNSLPIRTMNLYSGDVFEIGEHSIEFCIDDG